MKKTKAMLESDFIYSVLFGNERTSFEDYRRQLGISEDYAYIVLLKFAENNFSNAALYDVAKEYFLGPVGNVMTDCIIAAETIDKPPASLEEQIGQRLRDIKGSIKKKFGLDIKIAAGSVKRFEDIAISYMEAMRLMNGSNEDLAFTGGLAQRKSIGSRLRSEEDALYEDLAAGNMAKVTKGANKIFNTLMKNETADAIDIKLKIFEIALNCERICAEADKRAFSQSRGSDYIKEVTAIDSFGVLKAWFITKLEGCCLVVSSKEQKLSRAIAERAKKYIDENYQRDISLELLSREAEVSPAYLERAFEEARGEGFIEYLNALRIERAKELLKNTEKTIEEICRETGYQDPNYFNRFFLKRVGLTAEEYRRDGLET